LTRVPLGGDSLPELAAGKGQQIMEARRDEFLQLLAEHLAALEERRLGKTISRLPKDLTCSSRL
jgi:hypothetical protein